MHVLNDQYVAVAGGDAGLRSQGQQFDRPLIIRSYINIRTRVRYFNWDNSNFVITDNRKSF